MGNDLKQKILAYNGIINADEAKPTPNVSSCARCELVNPLENKYCSSCGYPLRVSAYEELKAEETKELNIVKAEVSCLSQELTELKDQYELVPKEEWRAMKSEIKYIMEEIIPKWNLRSLESDGTSVHFDHLGPYTNNE